MLFFECTVSCSPVVVAITVTPLIIFIGISLADSGLARDPSNAVSDSVILLLSACDSTAAVVFERRRLC